MARKDGEKGVLNANLAIWRESWREKAVKSAMILFISPRGEISGEKIVLVRST